MSANFKFKSFNDEEESEGQCQFGERAPETESQQKQKKKKIIPWENSSTTAATTTTTTTTTTIKGEDTIAKASIQTQNSVKTKTVSFISQFSRVRIVSLVVGAVFVILVLALIASNGAAIRRANALFEFTRNETINLHHLIMNRQEEVKRTHSSDSDHLEERIGSVNEMSRLFSAEMLANFTNKHLQDFQAAKRDSEQSINDLGKDMNIAQAEDEEKRKQIEEEVYRKIRAVDAEMISRLREERRLTARDILRLRGSLATKIAVATSESRSTLEEIRKEMMEDRIEIKETIGKLLEDIKNDRKSFDETIRDLSRDYCADKLLSHCSADANCINTVKGYLCSCHHGYHGDGKTCQDINECDSAFGNECHIDAACKNTKGSYTCTCKPGYSGDGLKSCDDIDECESNPCTQNARCQNTPGSFKCPCNVGYTGDGVNECIDADECAKKWTEDFQVNTNRCHDDGICNNTVGSYSCRCKEGFVGDGMVCSDIDECSNMEAKCSTEATCSNTKGSYSCSCQSGFTGDGKTCKDVDECLDPKANNCSADATCTNTHGFYGCTCKPGFKGDGLDCKDIDECADVTLNNCSVSATCVNEEGGFKCTCLDTHEGDGVTCTVNYMKTSGNYSYHPRRGESPPRKNWYQAQIECQKLNGYLAIVGDEAEDRLIRASSEYQNDKKYWVGGQCTRDRGASRNFWVHTNIDFSNSYPPNGNGRNTNLNSCDTLIDGIVIRGNFGLRNANAWDDIDADMDNRRLGYICEY